MLIENLVLEKLRGLPPAQQQEVLVFVEFLEYRHTLPLDIALARLREAAEDYKAEELDSLIEEAREEFYRQQNPAHAD
jgi:hypothetical protein